MIPILLEESHFCAVDKPSGLFSQAAPGIESLQLQLAAQLKQRDAHSGTPFVGLPHRLDRGTSGVMLIAKNQRALKRFGEQFQSRKIGKFYLGVVEGQLDVAQAAWNDYLRKVTDEPRAEVVEADAEGARLAQLELLQLATSDSVSLVLVHLHTGRMHQIRVQAASRGVPVLGDTTYGAKLSLAAPDSSREGQLEDAAPTIEIDTAALPTSEMLPAETSLSEAATPGFTVVDQQRLRHVGLALHALRLEFRHPQSGLAISATAPLPVTWSSLPASILAAAEAIVTRSQNERTTAWTLDSVRQTTQRR